MEIAAFWDVGDFYQHFGGTCCLHLQGSYLYETKLLGLSPRANYTDRATAATVGEISAKFWGWCHVVSVTDPYGSILDFLDRSRYFFFPLAPQLYSRG
jgi:hypothetical protein